MADKRKMPDPIIVDVQGVGPVSFPAGTTGAQIESWVLNHLKAQRPPQTWGEWGGNMAARVGGGIAGGVIGSLAGPVGTFAGTATGAAMGDEWAQSREVAQGVRESVNPLEMLAAGATAIPGATLGTIMDVGVPAAMRAVRSPAMRRLVTNEVGAVGDLAAAKALYLQRGGGQSPSRMMQALRDTGIVSGTPKTAADKHAAHAMVARLVAEAEGLPPPAVRPAPKLPPPRRLVSANPFHVAEDVTPVRSTADQRALDEMFARLNKATR